MSAKGNNKRRGAALVEFALMSLVLYMLVAAGIELGRAVFVAQTIQEAARVAARELALVPLPANETFDCPPSADPGECADDTSAVNDPAVLGQVWNPNLLVIDIGNCYHSPGALNTYVASLPAVNRALFPVFINEITSVHGTPQHFLRYPGALLTDTSLGAGVNPCPAQYNPLQPNNPTHFTVGIPSVQSRDAHGVETIQWVPVLEEVRLDPNHPRTGTFSFASIAPQIFDLLGAGIVSVAINYPFQSPALSGFRNQGVDANGAPNPNFSYAIAADDAGVTSSALPPNTALVDSECQDINGVVTPCLTYSGEYGLGKQYAFAGTVSANRTVQPTNAVRPYRTVLGGQATFRREVVR